MGDYNFLTPFVPDNISGAMTIGVSDDGLARILTNIQYLLTEIWLNTIMALVYVCRKAAPMHKSGS